MRYRVVATLLAVSVIASHLSAQSPTPKPTFAAASVKRRIVPGPSTLSPRFWPSNEFYSASISVSSLILFAFDIHDVQLVGGPTWIRADRFEVHARASRVVPIDQMRLMVQSLLEDRFKLVTQMERREMPIYALLLARPDGRLGPSLKRSDDDCKRMIDYPAGAGRGVGCDTMANLARYGLTWMDAPVVDKTGLTGKFEYLAYISQVNDDPPAYEVPLREQLGLRLEATRGPGDVLVINSVQQPTED
jgi:uncharacterized protein (TIGR03435 family)